MLEDPNLHLDELNRGRRRTFHELNSKLGSSREKFWEAGLGLKVTLFHFKTVIPFLTFSFKLNCFFYLGSKLVIVDRGKKCWNFTDQDNFKVIHLL